MNVANGVQRLRRKSVREWLLLAEAGLFLVAARIVLTTMPTRWIVRWVRLPVEAGSTPPQFSTLEEIHRAVRSFSKNSPIRLVCFPQALAMHGMLRRRRIASEILYGVARMEQGKLVAHAWLRLGDQVWLGGEVSDAFTVLDIWTPRTPAARLY